MNNKKIVRKAKFGDNVGNWAKGIGRFALGNIPLFGDNIVNAIPGLRDFEPENKFAKGLMNFNEKVLNPVKDQVATMAINSVAPGVGTALAIANKGADTAQYQNQDNSSKPLGIINPRYAQTGGPAQSSVKPVKGGNLYRLSSTGVYADGNSHKEGGIKINKDVEVEGGEGIHKLDNKTVISSDTLRDEDGYTFAEKMTELESKKGFLEKRLEVEKEKGNKNTVIVLKKKIDEIDKEIKELYGKQELVAKQMGLRDKNGNPNQASQDIVPSPENPNPPGMIGKFGGSFKFRKRYQTAGGLKKDENIVDKDGNPIQYGISEKTYSGDEAIAEQKRIEEANKNKIIYTDRSLDNDGSYWSLNDGETYRKWHEEVTNKGAGFLFNVDEVDSSIDEDKDVTFYGDDVKDKGNYILDDKGNKIYVNTPQYDEYINSQTKSYTAPIKSTTPKTLTTSSVNSENANSTTPASNVTTSTTVTNPPVTATQNVANSKVTQPPVKNNQPIQKSKWSDRDRSFKGWLNKMFTNTNHTRFVSPRNFGPGSNYTNNGYYYYNEDLGTYGYYPDKKNNSIFYDEDTKKFYKVKNGETIEVDPKRKEKRLFKPYFKKRNISYQVGGNSNLKFKQLNYKTPENKSVFQGSDGMYYTLNSFGNYVGYAEGLRQGDNKISIKSNTPSVEYPKPKVKDYQSIVTLPTLSPTRNNVSSKNNNFKSDYNNINKDKKLQVPIKLNNYNLPIMDSTSNEIVNDKTPIIVNNANDNVYNNENKDKKEERVDLINNNNISKLTKGQLIKILKNLERIENIKNPIRVAKYGGNLYKYKTGGWINSVTNSIKKRGTEGRCSGSNFGGPDCPPGSKQYNLAVTFRKMARNRKYEYGGKFILGNKNNFYSIAKKRQIGGATGASGSGFGDVMGIIAPMLGNMGAKKEEQQPVAQQPMYPPIVINNTIPENKPYFDQNQLMYNERMNYQNQLSNGKAKSGGLINTTGYLKGYKTSKNSYNIIPSSFITTKGMINEPINATPIYDNGIKGETTRLPFNKDIQFPGAKYVLEEKVNKPIKAQNGLSSNKPYDPFKMETPEIPPVSKNLFPPVTPPPTKWDKFKKVGKEVGKYAYSATPAISGIAQFIQRKKDKPYSYLNEDPENMKEWKDNIKNSQYNSAEQFASNQRNSLATLLRSQTDSNSSSSAEINNFGANMSNEFSKWLLENNKTVLDQYQKYVAQDAALKQAERTDRYDLYAQRRKDLDQMRSDLISSIGESIKNFGAQYNLDSNQEYIKKILSQFPVWMQNGDLQNIINGKK